MIRVKINGQEKDCPEGVSILEAASALGIEIPVLCHDSRLRSCGACRTCLVAVAGISHPVVSCMTALKSGMEVRTDSAPLEHARQGILRMLARKYPARAFEEFPDKPFHRLARAYGLSSQDFQGEFSSDLVDDSHAYIHVDMSRCIDCYRCVRICDEVEGRSVWRIFDRGQATHVVAGGTTLKESSCVSCGACVDTCPTGALEDKSVLQSGTPTAWQKTVCPYCGTGCEMNVGTRHDTIVQIKPSFEAPVSHGHLCVKGRYAFGFVEAPDRVTEPMIRRDGEWQAVSWSEAIGFTASRLREIVARDGNHSVGVLGSARATNEDNYLAQKFARVIFGTNNIDCCARVCHTPSAAAMKMMLGTGAATNSFVDIELARTIMICGANPTENHPIVGARIRQAIRNGTKLIVIDPRRTELTKYAAVHLQLRSGTDVPLLNSIAHTIIEEGLVDRTFVENRVGEFEKFRSFVSEYSPESVAHTCDVSAESIREVARIYASEKPAMCFHGLGLTEHVQGTEDVMCLINLALLTGNIGRRGAGINPLRGQNNVQGSAQMGCDPGILTGSQPIEASRESFERIWKAPIPFEKGLNAMQMIDAAGSGRLKALWAIGYDIYHSSANANLTKVALQGLELVIIQDMFLNATAREFGHVFFPAASSFERDGTFMNSERRVQRVRKVIGARGNSKPDWEIICELARAMGGGEHFDFHSPEEIWNEVRAVWPGCAGITYDRIETSGLQWPCVDEDDPGTEVLHADSFSAGERSDLRRIHYRPTAETVSAEFPILLTTGRSLYHFNAGTMSMRTANAAIRPSDLLVLNPQDGAALSINEAESVLVESRWGNVTMPVSLSGSVKAGEAFATFHSPDIFLNFLTGPHRDRLVQAPEYKVTAIRVTKLAQ